MKISNKSNRISFTSTPLYPLRLPRTDGKGFVKGVLSELTPNDVADRNAVRNISEAWKNGSNLINLLCNEFFGDSVGAKFYAIELMGNGAEKLEKRIIALSKVEIYPELKFPFLSYLVAKPELTAQNSARAIKNIGEALFGGICNQVRTLQCDCIMLTPVNKRFFARTFQNAHITEPIINPELEFEEVFLPCKSIDKYINYWRKNFCL